MKNRHADGISCKNQLEIDDFRNNSIETANRILDAFSWDIQIDIAYFEDERFDEK